MEKTFKWNDPEAMNTEYGKMYEEDKTMTFILLKTPLKHHWSNGEVPLNHPEKKKNPWSSVLLWSHIWKQVDTQ